MDDLITKTQLKEEFSLTERLISHLGEPDATRPNPHYRKATPLRLYSRERVVRWIGENQELITQAQARKRASCQGADTKRTRTRSKLAALLGGLEMRQAPSRKQLIGEAAQFTAERYQDFTSEVSERAICSYLRHSYTNYEAILASVHGSAGKGELYPAVKLYLCCQIIRRYRLDLDPLVAAFGSREGAPEAFLRANPEQVAAQALGLDEAAVER